MAICMGDFTVIVCSFTSPAADLKSRDRTPENLLNALRANPRVSCFDMSEKKWLRDMIGAEVRKGTLTDDRKEPYPWIRYIVKAAP